MRASVAMPPSASTSTTPGAWPWPTPWPRSTPERPGWTAASAASAAARSPRAPAGNVALEDLVHALDASGVSTGVDLDRLLEAARLACTADRPDARHPRGPGRTTLRPPRRRGRRPRLIGRARARSGHAARPRPGGRRSPGRSARRRRVAGPPGVGLVAAARSATPPRCGPGRRGRCRRSGTVAIAAVTPRRPARAGPGSTRWRWPDRRRGRSRSCPAGAGWPTAV